MSLTNRNLGYQLICYTRLPEEDALYAEKLAYSMHLALLDDRGKYVELNHNSGVLYAKAIQKPDGTLHPKNLKNPWIFQCKDGTYGVIAQRTEPDGSEDIFDRGKLLFFTSKDLVRYQEHPLVDIGRGKAIMDVACRYESKMEEYILVWTEVEGGSYSLRFENLRDLLKGELAENQIMPIEDVPEMTEMPKGMIYRNRIPISVKQAQSLFHKFTVPVNTLNEVPERIQASSSEEINRIKAVARYSDGTDILKKVDWYTESIEWSKPGVYRIWGRVHQNHYEFPVALHRADPCVGKWNGNYYFIATNDFDDNHSLYIREADTIAGLITAQEVKILDTTMYPHLGNLLWAPEFHIIKGKLYIFHAGTPGEFEKEQCHVMKLKENGNPMRAEDWEMPVKVVRKDGRPLYGEQGITLDMTEFEIKGKYYVSWSQRQFHPVDQGAWLYIAQINPDEPWKLITEPVLLTKPEYGWENNHTFVDEGAFALITADKIFLSFSGAAVDSTYVVGLLSADIEADLMDPSSWVKENYPLLSSRSVPGEYGPGHNAYVQDENGMVWNTYHARPEIDGPRSSGIRRVHFGFDGYPVLDMTEDRDLCPELAEVSMDVEIINRGKKERKI